jgi:UDP-N-acetylglucosamine 2-epimerase
MEAPAPRVMTIVGARPQFVKAATVSLALRARGLRETLVHSGQHYDPALSAVFFDQLGIPREDFNLAVGSGSHGEMTARILERLERLILDDPPAAVLVFGDTNSTLAGALAAVKLHVPVAHVEAGMRSFNRRMPEEINRVVTDHVATWHYCATATAARNLAAEGVTAGVEVVGDVMADAVLRFGARATFPPAGGAAAGLVPGRFVAMTCHRADTTDDPDLLAGVLAGVAEGAAGLPVVFPVHPRTRERIGRFGVPCPGSVRLCEPLPYLDMLALVREAAAVATDSGGMQKEAYLLGTPCVTLRTETEWVETVEAGWNRVAGTSRASVRDALAGALAGTPPAARPDLFGDGHAAERIAEHLWGVL